MKTTLTPNSTMHTYILKYKMAANEAISVTAEFLNEVCIHPSVML